jgi:hypothetical protein
MVLAPENGEPAAAIRQRLTNSGDHDDQPTIRCDIRQYSTGVISDATVRIN